MITFMNFGQLDIAELGDLAGFYVWGLCDDVAFYPILVSVGVFSDTARAKQNSNLPRPAQNIRAFSHYAGSRATRIKHRLFPKTRAD